MYSKPKPKRSTMKVHVPHDVILNHILPRVPPKSIGRFRCVSKEWHSLLTSKMFENMHSDHHQYIIKLLVFSKTETSSFEFTTIDCEAPPSDKGLTPARRPLPQFGDTTPPHDIHILTSFHGLVCLGIQKNKHDFNYSDLILWNPLTNEYKRLSKYNSDYTNTYSKFRLYYGCCEDDYKLLLVYNHVYIYSLKSDSWREVDAFQNTDMLDHWRWSRGTYLNENLYFLQHHYNKSSIIRFDTKTERLSEIETPNVDEISNAYNYFDTIVVKSDCIHVCVKYDIDISRNYGFGRNIFTCIKLWKLDEYENMKEVLTYQVRLRIVHDIPISSLHPFHLMKNGNWLMMRNLWGCYKHIIYEVDLKKNKHVKGNIYDDDDFEHAEVLRVDDNNDIVFEQYIETFLSPNRYMK
ncbi:putative F-box protein [Tanacetum coccineum]